MSEEIIDVVDANDEIIATAPRKGIHKTSMLHRAVHIFLLDPDGRIWLEQRGPNTDTYPAYYSSSAAGHVMHGEDYLDGARREALEELGIPDLALERKHKLLASPETSNEFVVFFLAHSSKKPIKHSDTEKLEPLSVDEINLMISRNEKFVPIFLKLFEWYKSNMLG